MFLGPLLHELRALPAAVRRRLRPRHPHRRAAPVGAEGLRPRRRRHPRVLRGHGRARPPARPAPSCSPSAATRSPRTSCWRRPATPARPSSATPSPNYMVQDLCFFLQALGVRIEGIGTTTLTVHGVRDIDMDVEYSPSEDPIEAMSLLAAAVVTESTITIRRVPIEFLEIELATLEGMGMKYDITDGVRLGQRPHPPRRPHHDPRPAPGADRQDPPDAVPGPQHRQPAVLRAHRGVRRGHDDDPRLGLREPRDLPHRADQGRRQGAAARPAPGHRSRARPEVARRRGDVPAGAAPGRRRPAGDAGRARHLGAAQRLRHQPRLRGPRRAAQRPRRDDRDLPRHREGAPAGSARSRPPRPRDCIRMPGAGLGAGTGQARRATQSSSAGHRLAHCGETIS